jgi:hypothetical protein
MSDHGPVEVEHARVMIMSSPDDDSHVERPREVSEHSPPENFGEPFHPDDYPFLVRTDFSHPEQWAEVSNLIRPAQANFTTHLALVDDPRWENASDTDLFEAFADTGMIVIADGEALSAPELPLLVLYVINDDESDDVVEEMRVPANPVAARGGEPDARQPGLGGVRGRG